jgi:TPR repeat protein
MDHLLEERELFTLEPDMAALRDAYDSFIKDSTVGRPKLEALVARGSTMSMLYLANDYKKRPRDSDKAAELYRIAYQSGSSAALLNLALILYKSGKISDAERLWSEGVAKNDPPSMYWLAHLYLNDLSNVKKQAEAARLLEQANQLGQIRATILLAKMHLTGKYGVRGIPRGLLLFLQSIVSSFGVAYRDPRSRRLW